jgi:hypothetical protein
MPYATWLPSIVPHWLQRQWGGGVIEAIGEELDELLGEMVQARKAMMPARAAAASFADALVYLGAERQLDRGPGESNAAYGARLVAAWATWVRAGSPRALLEQIKVAGFDSATAHVVQRSGRRVRLDGGGNLVITDGAPWTWSAKPPEAYAEFGILFTAPQPLLTWSAGAGLSQAAARLHVIAKRWRPAKADFMGTVIVNSGPTWGLMTWGSFTWGGSSTFLPP